MIIDKEVYTEPEAQQLFEYLDTLEVEYHKQYKRFNQMVKVPRGQASYTLHGDIHYDYKVSGGSPPNHVMTDTLKEITAKVNSVLGTNFNTILLNKYMNGDDCIGFHKDREAGWAPNTGFATLAYLSFSIYTICNNQNFKCFFQRAKSTFFVSYWWGRGRMCRVLSACDSEICTCGDDGV